MVHPVVVETRDDRDAKCKIESGCRKSERGVGQKKVSNYIPFFEYLAFTFGVFISNCYLFWTERRGHQSVLSLANGMRSGQQRGQNRRIEENR